MATSTKPKLKLKQTYNVLSLFSGMCGMDQGFAEQVTVHRQSVH